MTGANDCALDVSKHGLGDESKHSTIPYKGTTRDSAVSATSIGLPTKSSRHKTDLFRPSTFAQGALSIVIIFLVPV